MKKFYLKHKKLCWISGIIIAVFAIFPVFAGIIMFTMAGNLAVTSPGGMFNEDLFYDQGNSPAALGAPSAGSRSEKSVMANDTMAMAESAPLVEEKIEQKVIKSARLSLVIKKVAQAVEKITEIVAKKEGFVSDSNIYTREDKTQYGTITVRVPAKDFETALNEIKAVATVIEEESLSGTDVTEEFVDLQSRLKNLRLEEEQYQEILTKAKTVEEILQVNAYLFDTRENIELIEGRIKYLANLTDLATIRVNLSEEPIFEIPTAEWRPLDAIKNAFRSTVVFWQGLINVLIWVAFLFVPLAIVVWAIYKITKAIKGRRKNKSNAKTAKS